MVILESKTQVKMSNWYFMTFDLMNSNQFWLVRQTDKYRWFPFLTVKALGRVLLHLQCCGRLLQRKFGLSVCTRPLGSAMLFWWRDLTSWWSGWRLVGDGAGLCFPTGSDREQQSNRMFLPFFFCPSFLLCPFELPSSSVFDKCFFCWNQNACGRQRLYTRL